MHHRGSRATGGAGLQRMSAEPARGVGREVLLVAAAVTALTIGLLCYVAWRAPGTAQWLPAAAGLGAAAGGGVPGLLRGWLPSFVHPFAFALLTAAAAPSARQRLPIVGPCGGWWLVGIAFEAMQHPVLAAAMADLLSAWTAALPGLGLFARPLLRFATAGRFDVGDLAATTVGALAAALLLLAVDLRSRRAHEQP
ncbi:MAG: hypothetical protein ACK57B_05795 [Betaproteobacteria bacterium]|jgi:hypothetical protein